MKCASSILFILIITILSLCFLDRYSYFARFLPNKFRDTLCDIVHAKPTTPVDLSKLTDFKWEKAYIFGPYTSEKNINAILGFEWNGVSSTGISHDEGVNLIIFVKGGNDLEWFRIPRHCGDFEIPDELNGFNYDNAQFMVSEVDRGEPWLVLKPLGK